jgi:hypothetical protein
MADNEDLLLRSNLEQLRLPAVAAEFAKLAREAAEANEGYEQYLLRLTELEVAARACNLPQGVLAGPAGGPIAVREQVLEVRPREVGQVPGVSLPCGGIHAHESTIDPGPGGRLISRRPLRACRRLTFVAPVQARYNVTG